MRDEGGSDRVPARPARFRRQCAHQRTVFGLGIQTDDGVGARPDLHRNPRVQEGLDLPSQALAQRNLAYALLQGRPRVGVYWENPANRGGRAAGAATIIGDTTDEDGRQCREVLMETEREGEPADERLLTFCRSESGWLIAD